jgi:hypothetical protein
VPKIALELDCGRLKGKRVNSDNPISRETLETITGLSPRTQREYDRVATVKRQRNIAVGQKHTKIIAEEQYWQRGGAVFSFVDSQGKQGPRNREYLAWHMPNSYQAPHQQRSNKGRQKKINQQLVSLVENGVQGNDQHEVDKLFWPDGAAAGKAYTHDRELDAYWPRGKAQRRPGVIWYVLAGEVQ